MNHDKRAPRWSAAARSWLQRRLRRPAKSTSSEPTFLIPHFNAADFLAATLDAIRRFHGDSRIVVADATSTLGQLREARSVCRRFEAELHILPPIFRHTALLDYLLNQAKGRVVFLDQDCVLLAPLDALLERDEILIGPRDRMILTHPNVSARYSQWANVPLRDNAGYIHASLMILDAPGIRAQFGKKPFRWSRDLGTQQLEKYYGLCEKIKRSGVPMHALEAKHSAYGLGMVYLNEGHAVAYHNWYSGRIHGKQGEMDGIDISWLKLEADRFLHDFWQRSLHLDV